MKRVGLFFGRKKCNVEVVGCVRFHKTLKYRQQMFVCQFSLCSLLALTLYVVSNTGAPIEIDLPQALQTSKTKALRSFLYEIKVPRMKHGDEQQQLQWCPGTAHVQHAAQSPSLLEFKCLGANPRVWLLFISLLILHQSSSVVTQLIKGGFVHACSIPGVSR